MTAAKQTQKIEYRPKPRREIIGYCRRTADAAAMLIPARSLPVGRIPVVVRRSLTSQETNV
ncbi:MAG TPA: hypothetical protein VFE47_14070 [Tepidisphaeraceae bacterium]|jgi:hypothetical protein|nr:hypothetical protein [Tepidisphaeraceae bacterium]